MQPTRTRLAIIRKELDEALQNVDLLSRWAILYGHALLDIVDTVASALENERILNDRVRADLARGFLELEKY